MTRVERLPAQPEPVVFRKSPVEPAVPAAPDPMGLASVGSIPPVECLQVAIRRPLVRRYCEFANVLNGGMEGKKQVLTTNPILITRRSVTLIRISPP